MEKKERFEILLEEINRKMELLIEGHQTLDQKIDRIAGDLREEMQQMRGELHAEIVGVRDELKKNMDNMGKELRAEMAEIEKRSIERDKRIMEEVVQTRDQLAGKIDKISEKLLDHEKRIATLEKTNP